MSPTKQKKRIITPKKKQKNAKSVKIRKGIVANLVSQVTAFNKSKSEINTCPKAFLKKVDIGTKIKHEYLRLKKLYCSLPRLVFLI